MGTRGRKSSASLAVFTSPIEAVHRPDAPYDLTDEQTTEWIAIVNSMPADHWTPGNYALLGQLCRHIVAARQIGQMITHCVAGKSLDIKEYLMLLGRQEQESKIIGFLMRNMRLTQASVMRAETTKHRKMVKKPWDPE